MSRTVNHAQDRRRRRRLIAFAILLALLAIAGYGLYRALSENVNLVGLQGGGRPGEIALPEGFSISVYAEGLRSPRFIRFDESGNLFVAERGADRVIVLTDADGDGRSDSRRVFAAELDSPHSVILHAGAWYVGVPRGVIRLTDTDGDGAADQLERLIHDYPTSGHSTRTVEFLPDGRMVVSIGSSCNVCEEEDPRRAAIVAYRTPQGEGERVFARGLRNAVGLAVHPQTGELWVTNNGRDLMGDDLPPDDIYRVSEGADYGWPRCHSGRIADPEYGFPGACDGLPIPVAELQAHSAPLGLVFYDGDAFPERYQGSLFIAYHGSWNRSVPTGYKVVRLPFEGLEPAGPIEDFAVGWLSEDGQEVSGRPVGLAVGPDGALYVSDDKGGFIYRIHYTEPQ